jgi:hypothetical protein
MTEDLGLRNLTNDELVVWGFGREKLTQLEIELLHRLENIQAQRLEFVERIMAAPCNNCIHLESIIPDDAIEDIEQLAMELPSWQ